MNVCPLVFDPICKPKIWGGRNLERLLDKKLPPGESIGETWECADLPDAQSIVARGPARGKTLHELVETWGKGLLGRAEPVDGRFPLLLKFLDAAQNLSIQVHPDPATAKRLGGDVRVKHEAWYVVDAAPDAAIYRGLEPGVTLDRLAHDVRSDPASIVDALKRIPVKPGRTYYLPSGTLHALGAGVVVAEIQTPSDVTYRLYDWGRVRPESDAGLHVEEALSCIRTDLDPAAFEKKAHVAAVYTTVTRLVACPSFVIEKVRFASGIEMEIPYAELVCWMLLAGRGEIHHGRGGVETFAKGDTVILPAALEDARVKALDDCVWLEITIPAPSDLAGFARPDRAALAAPSTTGPAPIPLNIDVRRADNE